MNPCTEESQESRPEQRVESAELPPPAASEETGEPIPYAVIWKDGEELKLY